MVWGGWAHAQSHLGVSAAHDLEGAALRGVVDADLRADLEVVLVVCTRRGEVPLCCNEHGVVLSRADELLELCIREERIRLIRTPPEYVQALVPGGRTHATGLAAKQAVFALKNRIAND